MEGCVTLCSPQPRTGRHEPEIAFQSRNPDFPRPLHEAGSALFPVVVCDGHTVAQGSPCVPCPLPLQEGQPCRLIRRWAHEAPGGSHRRLQTEAGALAGAQPSESLITSTEKQNPKPLCRKVIPAWVTDPTDYVASERDRKLERQNERAEASVSDESRGSPPPEPCLSHDGQENVQNTAENPSEGVRLSKIVGVMGKRNKIEIFQVENLRN